MNILNKYTFKTLLKNKTRTLVTIIGIILSVAMFTAVTAFVASLRTFMIDAIIASNGDWHCSAYAVPEDGVASLKSDEKVATLAALEDVGYAKLADSVNEYKPYLYVQGMGEGFSETIPIKLISGRMPENSGEIILPKHLYSNGGVFYEIGDVLSLKLGERELDGKTLGQVDSYQNGDQGAAEQFVEKETRTYTVVGFYERPNFESYTAPGYTALTVAAPDTTNTFDVFIKLNRIKDTQAFMENKLSGYRSAANSDYLRMYGASGEDNFNRVLYNLAAIFISIILIASVSLIYNAFSISVSERTQQFGLLSSIGATKRQLRRSVLFEALSLSLIGIPLGVFFGMLGIGVTLKLTAPLFSSLSGDAISGIVPHLVLSISAMLIAAALGLVTVLISARIPAKRATRLSAIDAIRQTSDIKISAKKVKTSRLTYKLFGFPGMIARKNFKRSKRKYRATVMSLFLSVVLFITASSFGAYLTAGSESLVDAAEYDISYSSSPSAKGPSEAALYAALKSTGGVLESSYMAYYSRNLRFDADRLSDEYTDFLKKNGGTLENPERYTAYPNVLFIDDETYAAFLDANGLSRAQFFDPEKPEAVAIDFIRMFHSGEGRYYTMNMLQKGSFCASLLTEKTIEGYSLSGSEKTDSGETNYIYVSDSDPNARIVVSEADAYAVQPVTIGATVSEGPFGTGMYRGSLTLMYPYHAKAQIITQEDEQANTVYYFKADDHNAVADRMRATLDDLHVSSGNLYDVTKSQESNRALLTVVNVFSYGFIVLISLIAAANVFNTISTNINLRRREFAMLRSIGMTEKGFQRMMNYECLLYGIKGLALGLPVSIGITYLIYRSMMSGWAASFFIPWQSLVIAIASVFIVVFATMLYSTRKLRQENTVDVLKNENL